MNFLKRGFARAAVSALPLGLAWWLPNTIISALLTWLGVFLLLYLLRSKERPYLTLLCYGVLLYIMGFFWLSETIAKLGGFGIFIGGALFLLFCLISALQFIFTLWTFRNLPSRLDHFALRAPLAFVVWEFAFIKIFPWHIAHTQVPLTIFVQVADLFGSHAVSFIVLWLCEAFLLTKLEKKFVAARALSVLALFLTLVYGLIQISTVGEQISAKVSRAFSVGIVQANTSLEDKHNPRLVRKIIREHNLLSDEIKERADLILWPETAINSFIPTEIRQTQVLGTMTPRSGQALLFGALSVDENDKRYNSVLAASTAGLIDQRYNKQILMPFGEYTPFADELPFLREWNRNILDFDRGSPDQILKLRIGKQDVKVSALVCYEDVVSSLARDAVQRGAELLTNFTNDAWFGETVAGAQHHIIASFRAVETKRYLVRATNTGLSAVVNPLGQTVEQAESFIPTTLSTEVVPLSGQTLFSRLGNSLWWLMLAICACLLIHERAINRQDKSAQKTAA